MLPTRIRRFLLPTLAASLLAASGSAQAPAPERLTAEQRAAVLDAIAARVAANYIDADTGRAIAAHLRERARAGAYDALERPDELAEAVTRDLRAVNGDRHLYVVVRGGGGPGGGARRAASLNYGIVRAERLPGNVGYLDLDGISGAPEAREVLASALRFLGNTDAMILDLRGVPGGSVEMANQLISHFTAPGLPSLKVYWRVDQLTEERATLAEVPGPRRTEVPLYVLVDRGAASAAEDVPFVLQNLGRAIIVGEKTAGAGRNNRLYPAAHGLGVSVSVSRVSDPRTGREWEGVGVKPDLEASSETALDAAYAHALRRLAAAADEPRRGVLERAAEYVEAQAKPAQVPAERLASYAGRYAGEREVTFAGGRLWYRPAPDERPDELVPLADGRFALGPVTRVTFAAGPGGALRMRVDTGAGAPREFARER